MEFAITEPLFSIGSDDSWQPRGSRSFLLKELRAMLARHVRLRIGETLRLALIAVFGALGTLARYGLQGLVQTRIASTFPYVAPLISSAPIPVASLALILFPNGQL
jgi:hypothetical protein